MTTRGRRRQPIQGRRTLFDAFATGPSRNLYCRLQDLSNEASVEAFFVNRMLADLEFEDSQIKTKESLEELAVGRGHRIERYRPDYGLFVDGLPVCIVDAKDTEEPLAKWVEQCSGYCLALNRRFEGFNPVKYFVLSNGIATEVYEWDKEQPLLQLVFADFEWGNPKYQALKSLLSSKTIITATAPPTSGSHADFTLVRPLPERARQLFATCHKAIWKSEVGGPSYAFTEFIKIMFVKLWLDKRLREDPNTRELFNGEPDTVHVPSSAVIFKTTWIDDREAEGTMNPVATILFRRLRDDIEQEIRLQRKKRIFDEGESIRLRPDTVKDVVRRLEHFDMFGIDEDLNGRLFETYLSATMRGRELGQYFTPRSIVKTMTRLADLKATRSQQSKVLDGCCGSGGFLIEALTVMRNKVRENASLSSTEREDILDSVCNESLYGIDYAKEPPLSRIARINMYLHGDGGSRIYYADLLNKSLIAPNDADPELVQNVAELRERLADVQFDVVLTNPPFSMTKETKNDSEKRLLQEYTLAHRSPTSAAMRPSLRSSVMSIERYSELLRPGGTLITVIDDTLLASDQFTYVRDFIRSRFLVRGLISLPGDAFRRQGSRVKTSVLVLEKKRDMKEAQPPCFAYFAEYLGVDDLTPRASNDAITTARERAEAETDRIVAGYDAYNLGRDGPLVLQPERLSDRLDLKYCVPQFGRMSNDWRGQGVEVRPLRECVTKVENVIAPNSEYIDTEFTLMKVSYDGRCEVESVKKGRNIRAKSMYQVRQGQLIFSIIRATDGAIGIVPQELDGALVSTTSYYLFECASNEDTAYLWAVLRSHELRADMQSLSSGTGRYTTRWPEVGEMSVPWLTDNDRYDIGNGLIDSWTLEREVAERRGSALSKVANLGVESQESVRRWNASKPPK